MKSMVAVPFIISIAILCASFPLGAEESGFAVVVMVNEKEIVIDAGQNYNVEAGDRVGLFRTLTIHHPVSGKDITDKFPIGDVKVAQSSELLSIVTNFRSLAHPPKVGDLVRLYKWESEQEATAAAEEKGEGQRDESGQGQGSSASGAKNEADQETVDLLAVMRSGLGKRVEKRIAHYRWFLQKYPNSRFQERVDLEIAWLGELIKSTASRVPEGAGEEVAKPALKVLHPKIGHVEVDDDVQLVIATIPPELVGGAHLYIRGADDHAFEQVEMENQGEFYYRAHVDERYLGAPGTFFYFIEVSLSDGEIRSVAGSEEHPVRVSVKTPVVENNVRKNRSVARAVFEYVDFDIDKNVDDQYWSFEADFFYRLKMRGLYGIRVGTGYFKGTGGRLSEIEQSKDNNTQLAALYGYVEAEFEFVPLFHLIVRGLAGNQRSPGNDTSEAAGVFGLEGGLRIGEETKTNLILAGAIFEDVGYEGRIALEINQFRKIPITVEGLVTNFPVTDSHLGMRIVLGAGYRFTDRFALLVRGSWNARTITHTGLGAGASMAFAW